MTSTVTNETPIAMLTVGQLREVLNDQAPNVYNMATEVQTNEADHQNYVYGLRGIRKLFSVSHTTAQRYKDTIIKGAVRQNGKKIIVDVAKALELFDQQKKG